MNGLKVDIVRHDQDLFVSEPDPRMFGNGPNKPKNPNWNNANWLKSRFYFSFAEWMSGPQHYGVLRVLNDDLVQPARGFGTHPHRNMEIFTYIVSGQLTHKDSMGNEESLPRGSVQYMSAGTGVAHSEKNLSKDTPLRFLQVWILPREHNQPPNYGSYDASSEPEKCEQLRNAWRAIVDDVRRGGDAPVLLNQDMRASVALIEPGQSVTYELAAGRMAYFVQIEGDSVLTAGDGGAAQPLRAHDGARVRGAGALTVTNKKEGGNDENGGDGVAHVILIEMAAE